MFKIIICFFALLILLPIVPLSFANGGTDEMTNHLFGVNCQGFSSATIIDHYNTNFTVVDSKGLREWEVGFIASDIIHGYYLRAFFTDREIPNASLFEGASPAIHAVHFAFWINGIRTEYLNMIANNANGHSQLTGNLMPNRTIIAGDFVDFFINAGYLQVFWYQTNTTIQNQQQIFSTNIQIPSDFTITDIYQIFLPINGATFFNFTNFDVSVVAQQISNIFPHVPVLFGNISSCSQFPDMVSNSNLCFDFAAPIVDKNGTIFGVSEQMLSSDLG